VGGREVTPFGIQLFVDSQMGMAMNLLVDGALDYILRGGLGGRSMRADGNTKVNDVSSTDIVDETC